MRMGIVGVERRYILRGKAYVYLLNAAERPIEKRRAMRLLDLTASPPVVTWERTATRERTEALMRENSGQNET